MKSYTITCHDVYNAGASLQAYALQQYLISLGVNNEIIDYKPDYLSKHYSLTTIDNPKFNKGVLKYVYLIAKFPHRFINMCGLKKKRFDKFKNKFLILTEERYRSNDDLKINLPKVDIYVAGSDQIWNTLFNNGRDPAFYLDFAPDGKTKLSYAASFATEYILNEYKEIVKKRISRLDYIGVRETSGVKIVNNLGLDRGKQVMDPVFLLSKEKWDELESNSDMRIFKEKYLIVYDFDNNENIRNIAQLIAKDKNLKIYSFFKNEYSDEIIDNYGPIEFISLIKNSEYVISNSFHGTAFAIIYEKDFLVIDRKEKLNTRMRDLLKLLGLEERMVINSIENYNSIDYKQINQKITREVFKSKEFIKIGIDICAKKNYI